MRPFLVSVAAVLLLAVAPSHRLHAQAASPAPHQRGVREKYEPHPRIRAAIRQLEAAKKELQEAPHDFGGHRADALQAVDKAIEQLRLALQYDKK